ncbi:SGNH/GDSL hydrolase family protein [Pseudoxanthomonas dokdonensis]|uniref:Lysophospholipase n=1 Tax=Pseudoxanthomonas dokdonensis TaxID=344882 RepID=A0A0R0CMM2_9GAMM|nr:SGNH/GDSL hydrolase family protein [Pseudoxanthomonas dokdonensis]KRG67570.1 lysophospholipase [Pseudoxanthomonas dokdonensis]
MTQGGSLASNALRYLALGDSYTIGEGVAESARWPVVLAERLSQQGIAVQPPQIIARTGWTTDELDDGIRQAAPTGEFALVSLLIGVNNQYRGRSVEEYRTQFAALLWQAIGFAGNRPQRVLVVSIPDWGITPFARSQQRDRQQVADEIDAFNQAAGEVCAARGVAFVDITAISRDGGDNVAMLVDDGLHPSAAMYARWCEQVLPVARQALSSP